MARLARVGPNARGIKAIAARLAPRRVAFAQITGALLALLSLATAHTSTAFETPTADPNQIGAQVRSLLTSKCLTCHGERKRESKLDLRTTQGMLQGGEGGTALVPGSPAESRLYEKIAAGEMPPTDDAKLSPDEIELVRVWIEQGAILPNTPADEPTESAPEDLERKIQEGLSFWSLRKPKQAAVPNAAGATNPIDAFTRARLAERGLPFAPEADRRALARRVYFDLLGLPPSPEQLQSYLNDTSADAYPKLIDQLLRSPQYGERWGRHWLDVARYADTGGYETDIYFRNAWRYRDYVVKSFQDDKPYDRFVQEQIAADELWPDDLTLDGSYIMPEAKTRHMEARLGTGFYCLGPQIHESNMDGKKLDYERLTDWVDTTASVFMGLTLGCARCHDHKFDPFSQRDYFGLQAIFAGAKEIELPLMNAMEIADFKQYYPKLLAVDEARESYRLWEKGQQGKTPTDADAQEKRRLLEAIANAVLALPENAGSSPGEPWDGLMEVATASVLGHERPELAPRIRILSRGDLDRPRADAEPALPQALVRAMGWTEPSPGPYGGRKQLAQWLTSPDHPLTARVMVNRVWQWHFGQGLVATPSDFGRMGERPSNPELLDWLAVEFVARGWRISELHKLMMLSETYRQASDFANETCLRVDPENRLLWRMNRRRLEAEALWDSIHAVSGSLVLKVGGRPVMPPLSEDELAAMRDRWQWVVSANPLDHTRRGMYIITRRNFPFPMFEAFDAPVNAVSCPSRDVTTVAPQALWFLNSDTSFREAQRLAARGLVEGGGDPDRWLDRVWNLAIGRGPTPEEASESRDFLARLEAGSQDAQPLADAPEALAKTAPSRATALATFCLTLFNLNEFTYID